MKLNNTNRLRRLFWVLSKILCKLSKTHKPDKESMYHGYLPLPFVSSTVSKSVLYSEGSTFGGDINVRYFFKVKFFKVKFSRIKFSLIKFQIYLWNTSYNTFYFLLFFSLAKSFFSFLWFLTRTLSKTKMQQILWLIEISICFIHISYMPVIIDE